MDVQKMYGEKDMTAPAAIAAQLVDMRNVGTHKVLRLTIHVPEEQALAAIAAFGWPTGVNPVPIAIARLVNEKEVVQHSEPEPRSGLPSPDKTPPRQKETTGGAKDQECIWPDCKIIVNGRGHCKHGNDCPKEMKMTGGAKKEWHELSLAQQAGMLCNEPAFTKFLEEQFPAAMAFHGPAAEAVRWQCGVESRSDIKRGTPAGDKWGVMVGRYRSWMHHPELVP